MPPQATRKKKRGPLLPHTFVQAESSNLLGVVLVKDHPYIVLSKPQLNHLRAELMKRLDTAIDLQCVCIPQLQESAEPTGVEMHMSPAGSTGIGIVAGNGCKPADSILVAQRHWGRLQQDTTWSE